MKNKFGRLNGVTSLIMSIVSLLMGVILMINPTFTLTGLCSVVGAVLVVAGAVMLILYFGKAEYTNLQSADFAVTVCMIFAGILVMVRKEDISDIFPQFLAIFLVLSGIMKMQQAMDLFAMKENSWSAHFGIGMLISLLSGAVLVWPTADWFTAKDSVPLYMCILLVTDGILSIICLIHATAKKNQYRKLYPEKFAERIEEKED